MCYGTVKWSACFITVKLTLCFGCVFDWISFTGVKKKKLPTLELMVRVVFFIFKICSDTTSSTFFQSQWGKSLSSSAKFYFCIYYWKKKLKPLACLLPFKVLKYGHSCMCFPMMCTDYLIIPKELPNDFACATAWSLYIHFLDSRLGEWLSCGNIWSVIWLFI